MNLTLVKPIAFFDCEGTGLDVATDRIVSISVLKINPDGTQEQKDAMLNPGFLMNQEVIDIHGITNEMVADKPFFKNIAKSLFDFLQGCDLAGFNSNNYDIPLMVEEFLRCDIDFPEKGTMFIDVGNIFKKKEERSLTAAMKFYCGQSHDDAHSASADVFATYEVFKAQIQRYGLANSVKEISEFSTMDKRVDFAGKIVRDDDGDYVYNFGKQKGTKVKYDTSLAYWMLGKDFTRNTMRVVRAMLKEIEGRPEFHDGPEDDEEDESYM